jgi:hypothetical protein
LSEFHIDAVWKYLEHKFGFNLKKWKARFEEHRKDLRIRRRDLDDSKSMHFYHFGNMVINPVLNEILGRHNGYPTFNYMVNFIMTGKNQNILQ